MTDFEQLKKQWKEQLQQQPSNLDFIELKKAITGVKRKQGITNLVLLATVAVLIAFFVYIGAYTKSDVAWALGVMIAVLLLRVLIEVLSINKLRKMEVTEDAETFKTNLQHYYKKRLQVHYVLTPLILGAYSFSFWTLLPDFKASLSNGFYTYIVSSALVLLVLFILLIGKEIRKELAALKALQE